MSPTKYLLIPALFFIFNGLNGQNQDVPMGQQLTSGFQVPPVTAENFKVKNPGVTPNWKAFGELYAAQFTQGENNLEKLMMFDKQGNYLGSYEQLKKPAYPKAIDNFFAGYYPDEKYTIWEQKDTSGLQYYYAPVSDTLWFNKEGKYTWPDKKNVSIVSGSDLEFITSTAASQILDVTLAQLATVNATSPEVKNLAETRTKNNFELHRQIKDLSAQKHVHLPTELNLKQQKTLLEFNNIQGTEFDKAYTKYLIKTDKKNRSRLQKMNRSATDPEIKKWIGKTTVLSDENARLAKQAYCSVK